MSSILSLIRREPARALALLKAAITLAMAFGLHLSNMQQDALFVLAALIVGSGEATRAMVVPTSKLPVAQVPPPPDGQP